jgi:hypothetical protein
VGSGCADGTREGFLAVATYPNIAACAGGFRIAGVLPLFQAPACDRTAGNSGANPQGIGCNIEDLCAPGWHVCRGAREVVARSPTGCTNASPVPGRFFAARQSSTGCGYCATGSITTDPPCNSTSCAMGCAQTDTIANDVFGCGSVGAAATPSCAPFNVFSGDKCVALPPVWQCGSGEALTVTLQDGTGGGALCCRDVVGS